MGIGKNATQPVKLKIPEPRPKGLGLGARIQGDPITYKGFFLIKKVLKFITQLFKK